MPPHGGFSRFAGRGRSRQRASRSTASRRRQSRATLNRPSSSSVDETTAGTMMAGSGPGFYWCGYALRRGLGWGGGVGCAWLARRPWPRRSSPGAPVGRPGLAIAGGGHPVAASPGGGHPGGGHGGGGTTNEPIGQKQSYGLGAIAPGPFPLRPFLYLDLWPFPQYIAATCCRPVLTDIRRGFEIPRTIEPACRLILQERAGR